VTLSVWKAVFLREALDRISKERLSWVWVLLEPIIHIGFFLLIFALLRARQVGGIDTLVWIMVGMLAFFFFRRPAQQGINAIQSNRALFTFRQVKPLDVVLVRAMLEGFLMLMIAIMTLALAGLAGYQVMPSDPLAVLLAIGGMWLNGVAFALSASVFSVMIPELAWLLGMLLGPLYFLSGILFPIALIPQPYRDWLLFNPLVHGLEVARHGFSHLYQAVPEASMAYLYGFALVGIFFGLALHLRFSGRLAAQ